MYFYFWLIFWKKKKNVGAPPEDGLQSVQKISFLGAHPVVAHRRSFLKYKKKYQKKSEARSSPLWPPCLRPWSQPISQIMYFLFSVTFKLKFCMKSFVVFWSILTELTDYVFLTICYILTKIF